MLVWQEMERLNYDAVALGELELRRWGLTDSLMRSGSTLPLVTTNIERRVGNGWQPLAPRYRTVDVEGVRVAFISALPEGRTSTHALEQTRGALRLLPWLRAARETAGLLKGRVKPGDLGKDRLVPRDEADRIGREQVDLVVLLAYLDKQTLAVYADSLPEVDVILGGIHQLRDERPIKLGHAVVNRSGDRGVIVSRTELVVSPANEIVGFDGSGVVLEESMPEDPDVAALANAAHEASEELRLRLREVRKQQRVAQEQRERAAQTARRDSEYPSDPTQSAPAAADSLPGARVRGRAR